MPDNPTPEPCLYIGWAVDRPNHPLYVQCCGTEAEAWKFALGWPAPEDIAHAKATGSRAFEIEIRERVKGGR